MFVFLGIPCMFELQSYDGLSPTEKYYGEEKLRNEGLFTHAHLLNPQVYNHLLSSYCKYSRVSTQLPANLSMHHLREREQSAER